MALHETRVAGALTARSEEISATAGSPYGAGWRILRAISQERDEREGCGGGEVSARGWRRAVRHEADSVRRRNPGAMESFNLSLPTRSLWFTAAIATMVLGVALALVFQLVSVADDPQLARQIGWNLLF